jgi:glyoxylase-like metal-dependent hydrolase (beta-lactamase superfamily II)
MKEISMSLTRRHLITQAAGLSCAAGIVNLVDVLRSAHAAERGPPLPPQPIISISPHVSMIKAPDGFPTPENQGMMANVTFITGQQGHIVIDSGASVQIAEMAIGQLKTRSSKPVIGVINTHYHGDHWLGNQAFVEQWGNDLPIYAHAGAREMIAGAVGMFWRDSMERWTDNATSGTRIVQPEKDIDHGFELSLGDVHLRAHHYGTAHTPNDICIEVVEDNVMCVGDVMMDHRIANMEDGSYQGTFAAIDQLVNNSHTRIWLPGHGTASADVIIWQRQLFEGIWESCVKAVEKGIPLDGALAEALKDPRVASRAADTKGWDRNIGKYVSIAYLEAEQAQF